MSDSIDFESEGEQEHGYDSRRQRYLGKRPARELQDDFELGDFDQEPDDGEERVTHTGGVKAVGSGSSSRLAHDPMDAGHHEDEAKPTFRPVRQNRIQDRFNVEEGWKKDGSNWLKCHSRT